MATPVRPINSNGLRPTLSIKPMATMVNNTFIKPMSAAWAKAALVPTPLCSNIVGA